MYGVLYQNASPSLKSKIFSALVKPAKFLILNKEYSELKVISKSLCQKTMNSLILSSHPLSTYRINKCKVAEHTIPYKDWSGNILMLLSFQEICWVCVFSKLVNNFCSISDTVFSNIIASLQTHTHWQSTYSIFYFFSPLLICSLTSSFLVKPACYGNSPVDFSHMIFSSLLQMGILQTPVNVCRSHVW